MQLTGLYPNGTRGTRPVRLRRQKTFNMRRQVVRVSPVQKTKFHHNAIHHQCVGNMVQHLRLAIQYKIRRGTAVPWTIPKRCQTNNITHELSSPYNPKSNGLAEAGVKNIKLLLAKCSATKGNPQRALYNWRNIPRKDGYSPAQLLMGRKQFTQLPAAPAHYELYNPATAQKNKDKSFRAAEKCHDQHTSFLPVLRAGDRVTLQDPHTMLWDQEQEGTVTEMREDKLSYIVQVGNRLFVRSRKMLKLNNSYTDQVNIMQENPTTLQSLPQATSANTFSTQQPPHLQESSWEDGF